MSKLPTADEARKITQDKVTKHSSRLIELVIKALNEAAEDGQYHASVSVPKELNSFAEHVINIMKSAGYEVKWSPSHHDQRDGYLPGTINFSWKPK